MFLDILGDNLFAAGRQFVDDGEIQVAVDSEREGARNGRCSHDEDIGPDALFEHLQPLHHAEAMLFVNDGEAQLLEFNVLLYEGMGADHDLGVAAGNQLLDLLLFASGGGAGQQDRRVAELRRTAA